MIRNGSGIELLMGFFYSTAIPNHSDFCETILKRVYILLH